MKKLLSVFAAAAVLFGFASCSGDMHDSVVSSLYAEGDFCEKDGDTTVRVKFDMTPGSDTEQTYVFKYDSKMTAWGGSNGTVNFKIVRDETGWLKDWGWLKDTKVELSVNSTEWLDLEGSGGSNDNPGNIVLKDLVVGNSYKLILKYDAPAEKVSIKCTGAVTDYPILKAHIVDAADGKELTDALADDNSDVILVRSGTSYSSEIFVPTKDGKIEYYLTNGYLYWGADGEMSTTKPTDDYFVGEWKFDENNADFPYSFFVDANKFADSAKFNSDVRIYDTSILSNADIIGLNGDWNNGKKLSFIDGISYTYDFTAKGATDSFVIRENAGTWDPRWFAGIPAGKDKPATAKLADDIKVGEGSVEAVYYEKNPGMAGSNLTITGLSEKSIYTITIKIEDAASKTISISCQLKQYVTPPKKYDVTINVSKANGFEDNTVIVLKNFAVGGAKLDGSLFSWCGGSAVTLDAEGPFEIDATCTEYGSWVAQQCDKPIPAGSAAFKDATTDAFYVFELGKTTTIEF